MHAGATACKNKAFSLYSKTGMPDHYLYVGLIIIIGTTVMFGMSLWMRQQRFSERNAARQDAQELKLQEQAQAQAERMALRHSDDMKNLLATLMQQQEKIAKLNESKDASEGAGLNSGGYIIFDMPEAKKGVFHDLLKGFEDYAKLRGYIISFSIDNSFPNKSAFKFTLDSQGIIVSTTQVRQDLNDYLRKIQTGESIDDMPMILRPEEHSMVTACLKNRISFLQHNLELERTGKEFFRKILNEFSAHGLGISQPQNFYIGDGNQTHTLQALNSPQAAVGTGIRLIGNRIEESIHIANSFNERKEQVDALSSLWVALYDQRKATEEGEAKEKLSEAEDYIQKAKTEMTEEEPPDPTRIHRWLETAKYSIKAFGLTKEVVDAAKAVWDLFHMSF